MAARARDLPTVDGNLEYRAGAIPNLNVESRSDATPSRLCGCAGALNVGLQDRESAVSEALMAPPQAAKTVKGSLVSQARLIGLKAVHGV